VNENTKKLLHIHHQRITYPSFMASVLVQWLYIMVIANASVQLTVIETNKH